MTLTSGVRKANLGMNKYHRGALSPGVAGARVHHLTACSQARCNKPNAYQTHTQTHTNHCCLRPQDPSTLMGPPGDCLWQRTRGPRGARVSFSLFLFFILLPKELVLAGRPKHGHQGALTLKQARIGPFTIPNGPGTILEESIFLRFVGPNWPKTAQNGPNWLHQGPERVRGTKRVKTGPKLSK